ncbi:transposase [Paenibacillus silvisoli]|uniref:transposase n=1 Tax=Paenibacillus silvisoli TaxID=3110539 RepID=UPI00389944E6
MPLKKGQKLKTYSDELKKEAIRLHVVEGWNYRKINEHLGILDPGRLKRWMRKYREHGEFGLLDQRGRKDEYVDQDRYVQKLQRENDILKKCLGIWMREVKNRNSSRSKLRPRVSPSAHCVSSSASREADTTPS